MTAAVFRNTPSMSVPLTQNTAPVLEFNCLYTHDSRKKQKKWQDGFLRYHTFNKRVMVYDVPRNFIGDMHWAGNDAVQDGDELTLERGGVMVEVGESIGQTETDLTELRKSKNKAPAAVHSQTPARTAQTPRAQPASGNVARPNPQLKHKSLNALLGPAKGPIGKAQLPTRSPFEERHVHNENEDRESGRPVKRPRVEVATGRVSALRPEKRADGPLQSRTANVMKRQDTSADLPRRISTKEVIHWSDDDEPAQNDFLPGFSDDVLRRSSSPSMQRSVDKKAALVRSSSPAFQVQQIGPTSRRREPQQEVPMTADIPQRLSRSIIETPSGFPANALPKPLRNDTSAPPPEHPAQARPTQQPGCDSQRPESSRIARSLRLPSTGLKKRTLLCQDQVIKKPRLASTDTNDSAKVLPLEVNVSRLSDKSLTTSEKLQARIARIAAKKQSSKVDSRSVAGQSRTGDKQTRTAATIQIDSDEDLPDGPSMDFDQAVRAPPAQATLTSHETSALQLASLDQRMLPPAAPRQLKPIAQSVPPSPEHHVAQAPPPKEERQLRRVLSESTVTQSSKPKRIPGAPVRYTPSPTGRSRESTPASGTGSRQVTPVPVTASVATSTKTSKPGRPPRSPPDRTAYKKKGPLQKSVSLNMTANGTSTVILSKPFEAPGQAAAPAKRKKPEQPKDLGPWSREAFDLFNWRPPGWNEEKWCLDPAAAKEGSTTTTASATSTNASAPPPGLSGGAANILPMFGRPVV